MSGPWWATRRFALAAVLLAALPLIWFPLPPLTDLPVQLGRYRVMLGGDDADLLHAFYRFEWRAIGYLGVDLLVAALAPLIGLEPAVKAIVIAIPMLMTGAMLWISHEVHGRVQPMALLALPFAYHLGFQLGFLNYALAVALALAGFALWLRLGRQGRIGERALIFTLVGALVWTAHVFGWLILGLLAFAAEVARQRAAGHRWPIAIIRGGIGCLPLALPAVMFLGWQPGSSGTGSDWLASLPLKPGWLVMSLRDRWRWFDVATILIVALLIYRAIRHPQYRLAMAPGLAALLLLALFVAMPFGSAYGDARIAPLVWIMALLAVRSDETVPVREQAIIALIGLALLGMRTSAGAASFAIENNGWARHLEVLDHIPRGARLVSFVQVPCAPAWRLPRTVHLPSMALARRAAFTNDQPDLGSAALLRVTMPGITDFANDPSQIVTAAPCPASPEFRTLRDALENAPLDRFDHVWLIDTAALNPADLNGLRVVWRRGDDFLLAVTPSRLSPAPSTD